MNQITLRVEASSRNGMVELLGWLEVPYVMTSGPLHSDFKVPVGDTGMVAQTLANLAFAVHVMDAAHSAE